MAKPVRDALPVELRLLLKSAGLEPATLKLCSSTGIRQQKVRPTRSCVILYIGKCNHTGIRTLIHTLEIYRFNLTHPMLWAKLATSKAIDDGEDGITESANVENIFTLSRLGCSIRL